jgi:hypothetical protein
MSTLLPADISKERNQHIEWQLRKAKNKFFEGVCVETQKIILIASASLHSSSKIHLHFSSRVCDMMDDPIN